ncbi:hypothetical protein PYW08_012674 [Mythimna loreyi]|uniref:Uncharacterized protein n=1 Tax=Mythimna loreyi TaxID=667449 RepID=A0ACC2Q1D8_9NEOP|nr:hypothetical protein PYW08_012674 [Mythimna loreyi]
MVVTRSQNDLAELEEQRRDEMRRRQAERIQQERIRRLSLNPPASPQPESMIGRTTTTADLTTAGPSGRQEVRSPAQSVRSTATVRTRIRLAELEAAEKLAAIRRKELDLEAELVKKRLAVDVSVIQDEESVHEEPTQGEPQHNKVDRWLRANPPITREEFGGRIDSREEKQLRFDCPASRARSPTPTRGRNSIEQLAATLEKMARPRLRHTELPSFSGAVSEWLPFKAAYNDTTSMYSVSPAENLQRLRSSL